MMHSDPNLPQVGDRVKVVVAPHGEGQDEGVVRQVVDGALGIEFDAMPGMVHHWYVPSEVMVTERAEVSMEEADTKKKKMPMPMQARNLTTRTKTDGRWFRFQNATTDDSVTEIHIIDIIGGWYDDFSNRYWGEEITVTARAFVEQLAKLPDTVKALHVHINSPGGDVQGGINIANALREQQTSKGRTVETYIDGMAASIASVIAMAGSKVHIADNALVMIHDPWGIEIGNAAAMRKYADVLDTIRTQAVNTYRWHSPLEPDAIEALMAAETWMDADEAIANGFATDKVAGLKAAAMLPAQALAHLKVPDKFKARIDALLEKPAPAPTPADPLAVLAACREAGCPELAEPLIGEKATLDQVQARVASAKAEKQAAADREATARAAAQARAEQITAACRVAGVPELADGYAAGGMTLDQVRAHLATLRPRLDRAEIDGRLSADQRTTAAPQLNASDIYAARNAKPSKE